MPILICMVAPSISTSRCGSLSTNQGASNLSLCQLPQLPLAQDLPQADFETLLRSGKLDVNYFLRPLCGASREGRHSLDHQKVQFILNEPGLKIEAPIAGYPQGVIAGSQESKAVSLVVSRAKLSPESLQLLASYPAAAELMPVYRPEEVLQQPALLTIISRICSCAPADVRAQAAGVKRGMQET